MGIKLNGVIDLDFLKAFLDKDYRDGFMQEQVRTGIAYQMQALRKKLGLTQREMGERIGKPQPVVSRLEDDEYGSVTVQTLLDVASKLDIALLVQFVDYPEFLKLTEDMSDEALQPNSIHESVALEEKRQETASIAMASLRNMFSTQAHRSHGAWISRVKNNNVELTNKTNSLPHVRTFMEAKHNMPHSQELASVRWAK